MRTAMCYALLLVGCSNDFDDLAVGSGGQATASSSVAASQSSAATTTSSSDCAASSTGSSNGGGGGEAAGGAASGGGGSGGTIIVPVDSCPGAEVVVASSPVVVVGDTSLLADDSSGGVCAETPSGGDAVYALMPAVAGDLTVTYHGDFKKLVYRSGGTCDPGDNEECDLAPPTSDGTLSFPVMAGAIEYVFVDGYDGGEGPYTLTLMVR